MYHQPIPAFEGSSPFIYACFCTEDEDLAYPVLARMYNEGFRLWPAQVGSAPSDFRSSQRLSASSHVILFMSRAMSELMRREGGKVAAVLRSSCLRTVVLLDDVDPSNDTYALSAPDRVIYNPMNDSPFWLYIYNSEHFEKCRGAWPEKKLKIGAPEFEDVSENSLGEEYDLLSDIIRRGTPMRQTAEIAFSPVMQQMQTEDVRHPVGAFAHRPLDSAVSEVVGMIDLHLEQTAARLTEPEAKPEPAAITAPIAVIEETPAVTETVAVEESAADPEPEAPAAEHKADAVVEVTETQPEPAEPVPVEEITEPVEEPVETEPAEETADEAAELPVAAIVADEPAPVAGQSQVNVVVRMQSRRTKTKVVARRRSSEEQPLHLNAASGTLRSRTPVQIVAAPAPVEPVVLTPPPAEQPLTSARRHRSRPMPAVQTVEAPVEPVAAKAEPETADEQPVSPRKNRHEHNSLNLRRLLQIARSTVSHEDAGEQVIEESDACDASASEAADNSSLCAAVSRFLSAYGPSTVMVTPRPALQHRQR